MVRKRSRFVARLRWELDEVFQALKGWRLYRTLAAMAVGIAIAASVLNSVVFPLNLFPAGVTGIAALPFYLYGYPPVGLSYLALNLPLFIIGWREFALKYVLIALTGVLMFSGALELTSSITFRIADPLMGSIIGGALVGAGSGIYLKFGGSAGGLDILGTYIKKRFAIPIGTLFNSVNAVNLLAALIVFDVSTAFYSGVYILVTSWMIDKVQTGFSQRRAVFIITDMPEAVAQQVMKRLDRGVTFLSGAGARSGDPKKIIYSVINMLELGRLKDLLFQIDPHAFVAVHETSEVIGRRFLSWEDEGYRRTADVDPTPHL
jgi:uncharacterized membrane-anchored protein YitT (DUF2179 family)